LDKLFLESLLECKGMTRIQ